MNFNEFIAKWDGQAADWDGAYGDQCVDLARYYWSEVCEISQPRSVEGAKDFWVNFETDRNLHENFSKIPNSPEAVPAKGDVMVWGSSYGPWGHIAIFTTGNVDSFNAFSQNDPTGALSKERYYINYAGVLGWFRPNKDVNNGSGEPESNEMTAGEFLEKIGVKNFTEAIGVWEREMGFLKSEREKNEELKEKNTELTATIESQKEQIRVLNDELEACKGFEGDFTIPTIEGFEENGLEIQKKTNDGLITINYRKK